MTSQQGVSVVDFFSHFNHLHYAARGKTFSLHCRRRIVNQSRRQHCLLRFFLLVIIIIIVRESFLLMIILLSTEFIRPLKGAMDTYAPQDGAKGGLKKTPPRKTMGRTLFFLLLTFPLLRLSLFCMTQLFCASLSLRPLHRGNKVVVQQSYSGHNTFSLSLCTISCGHSTRATWWITLTPFNFQTDYYRDADRFVTDSDDNSDTYRLTVDCARLEHTGAYSVVARNSAGEAKSLTSIKVSASGNATTSQPKN